MIVLQGECNAEGSALYLGFKPYKNMQSFYVGNSRLTGMMLCPYSCMEKVFLALFKIFLWSFITLLKLGRELYLTVTLIRLNNLWSWLRFWEMFIQKADVSLIFVETLRLYGGLKHIMSRFLFLVLFVTVDAFLCCWNVILCLNALSNVLLYKSLDLLNVLSAVKVLILLDMLSRRFLVVFGRWLERMLIYNGLLSGLLYKVDV